MFSKKFISSLLRDSINANTAAATGGSIIRLFSTMSESEANQDKIDVTVHQLSAPCPLYTAIHMDDDHIVSETSPSPIVVVHTPLNNHIIIDVE